MNKVQSLDLDNKYNPNKRAIDAKMYRQKLIEEARMKQKLKDGAIPSYSTIDDVKKQLKKVSKKKHDAHGAPMSEKASFGQCAFNMANILMVRFDFLQK